MTGSLAVRLQHLDLDDQVLVLARIISGRKGRNEFSGREVDALSMSLGLPSLGKIANRFQSLESHQRIRRGHARGVWMLTPLGRADSEEAFSQVDIAALLATVADEPGSEVGHAVHPIIPASLAPPQLLSSLQVFLRQYPFETNVFAMTRFPDDVDDPEEVEEALDPIGEALKAARQVCEQHGFMLHLASDRSIVPDLWENVAAHMWASRYGIAFFEDRLGEGLNYNLTLEVGSMIVLGRRCALLKDSTIERMPTDLVGKIYIPVDLSSGESVTTVLHSWFREDLALGSCPSRNLRWVLGIGCGRIWRDDDRRRCQC